MPEQSIETNDKAKINIQENVTSVFFRFLNSVKGFVFNTFTSQNFIYLLLLTSAAAAATSKPDRGTNPYLFFPKGTGDANGHDVTICLGNLPPNQRNVAYKAYHGGVGFEQGTKSFIKNELKHQESEQDTVYTKMDKLLKRGLNVKVQNNNDGTQHDLVQEVDFEKNCQKGYKI